MLNNALKVEAAQEHLKETRKQLAYKGGEDSIKRSSQMMFDTFKDSLKLFISSIKFQDPMDPVDTSEMAKQMFQLSQAQGQYALLEKTEEQNELLRAGQVLNASALIGKTLEVKSDKFTLDEGEVHLGALLPEGASKARLEILDDKGLLVYEKELTPGERQKYIEGGKKEFLWAGDVNTVHGKSLNGGNPLNKGNFSVRVLLYNEQGKFLTDRHTDEPLAAQTTVRAKLTGSDFADKQPKIRVGNQNLPLSAIVSIQQEIEKPQQEEINRGTVIRHALDALSEEDRMAFKARIQAQAKIAKENLDKDQGFEQEVNYLPPELFNELVKEIEEKLNTHKQEGEK